MQLTVPTIEEQTGWNGRPMPVSICQDYDVLRRVSQYDFDLYDPGFRDYLRARGVSLEFAARQEECLAFHADHTTTREDHARRFPRAIPSPQFPEGKPFSDHEMEEHWQRVLAAKGAYQDCWQLYLNKLASDSAENMKCAA